MSIPPDSGADSDWPPLDERLVTPGTRYEMLDGELIYVPPADGPHGTRHAQLAAVLEAHVTADFQVAVDMLTRTSKTSDIAPDASVFPRGPHPVTGRRQLDHLSFEIASTQTLAYVARKARSLAARGVRRVFAISIDRKRVLEWSRELDAWTMLDPASAIADPALAVPLPIAALAHAIRAEDVMSDALRAKRTPAFLAERDEGRIEGRIDAIAAAVIAVLTARALPLADDQRAAILAERDLGRLERWLARAVTCARVADLLVAD